MIEAPLILIVDDDPLTLQATTLVLDQAGYRTSQSITGLGCLQLIPDQKPNLILLDVNLPDISGFEVCRQIKSDPTLSGCFVVLISGMHTDTQSHAAALKYGADGYIVRPVRNQELIARVQTLLHLQQTQQALRKSESDMREVLENTLDAAYKRNLKTNGYEYLSPVITRLSGYTPQEFSNLPLADVIAMMHPDDLAEVERILGVANSRPGGLPYQVEYRLRNKEGQYRWFQDRFTFMRDPDGQPAFLIGSLADITERKETEDALRESEKKFSKAFQHTPTLFSISSVQDGKYIDVNDAFLRVSGYSRDEVIGKTSIEIGWITSEDRKNLIEKIKETGRIETLELVVHTKNGRSVPCLYQGELISYQGSTRLLSIAQDISDIKVKEKALLDATLLNNEIIQSAQEGIIVYDRNLRYVVWNSYMEHLTSTPASQVIGTHPLETFPFLTGTGVIEQLQGALAGGPAITIDYPFNPPEGNHANWTAETTSPLRNAEGDIIGVLVMVTDISTRKLWEEKIQLLNNDLEKRVQERTAALQHANLELARASRMKDEFLASMSHELRTPLTGILGLSESLIMNTYGDLSQQHLRILKLIEGSGRHLLELINDILDLSKIEAGKFDLELAPSYLTMICHACIQMTRGMAQKKNQQIGLSINVETIVLHADARRIKQILVNLISNAIKFTPEGGKLGLEVFGDAPNHNVQITVWDNGIGIKTEDLPRLFQPFTQLDSSLSRNYQGTGLGLSLVQRLTAMHGGHVEVKSTPGQGSRFTIVLPWDPEANSVPFTEPQQVSTTPSDQASGQHILLADDNKVILDLMTDYLRAKGFRVTPSADGNQLLQQVSKTPPADILLIDIQMPGLDGVQVIQRIRANSDPRIAGLPIIAITALAMPGDRERIIAAGANEYMSKPLDYTLLVGRIRTLCKKN